MKKIIVSIALIVFIQQLISCNLGKSEKYVDPYAFSLNPTVKLKSTSAGLAIAVNSAGMNSLVGINYLIDISTDGKIDTVRFYSTNGIDVTDMLNVLFLQNISPDYTLIGLSRNSGIPNEAYLLNKNDKSIISLTSNEIPVGMSAQAIPDKQFVRTPAPNEHYYVARVNNLERIIKLTLNGTNYTSMIISKDTMMVNSFNVDKSRNAWTSYFPTAGGAGRAIIINSSGQNLTLGKQLQQNSYWVNADKELYYNPGGIVYRCLYNAATNSLSYPVVATTPSQVTLSGRFSNARYSDYLYTFSEENVVVDDKTSLTVLSISAYNRIVSCDFAAQSKKGVIAGRVSTGNEALFTVTMANATVQTSKVINEGIYTFNEVEILEDGTIYFSAKRLADGKNILAKRDVAGTVTVLSDAFLGSVEFIETTSEFTNRY